MPNPDDKPQMVGWYDPRQLIDTARKTFISRTIGENADPRLVAATGTSGKIFDYERELRQTETDFEPVEGRMREEIWLDYVSDVGDGWNSTYAVAYHLARPELEVNGVDKPLQRGEILILGGDAVYPTAHSETYERRLIRPYKMAFKAGGTKDRSTGHEVDLKTAPHVFALPGNHDWYDSLVAFQKIFCTHFYNRRVFAGGWRTRQEIGYFALKLPHKWWLLGIDLQLSHSIDVRQLKYFEAVVRMMESGDRVILCVPEPFWVKTIKYEGLTDIFEEKEESVERLEDLLRRRNVEIKVYIAGDLHHYRRFESNDPGGVQKITAGGGGAFLHPTHDFDFNQKRGRKKDKTKGFSLRKNYPTVKKSKTLDWANLYLFGWKNKTFGLLTALLYAVLAWLVHGKVEGELNLESAIKATLSSLIDEPSASVIIIVLLITLVFFTDSNSKIYKWVGGLAHGLAHLAAIFLLGWLGYYLSLKITGKPRVEDLSDSLTWYFSVIGVSLAGGYVIGSFIMGLYLFVSLHVFGRHDNEAFSALKIEDYKNFLRLHIDKNGELTIYPLKIERVPRDWEAHTGEGGNIEYYTPKGGTRPELIEEI